MMQDLVGTDMKRWIAYVGQTAIITYAQEKGAGWS